MASLAPAEKFELVLLPWGAGAAYAFTPRPPLTIGLGTAVAAVSLLLLLQGFVRDLWLLRSARRNPPASPGREARCLCVESAIGLTGVIAGVGLVGCGLPAPVHPSPALVATITFLTLTVGFLLKDYVFEWAPWRLYREKNHAQVVFRWRR